MKLLRNILNGLENKQYKGEDRMAKLIMLLNQDGRLSDIVKVSQNKEYRQELYEEYHII